MPRFITLSVILRIHDRQIEAQTAAYLYHVAKNHLFVDGNKRTVFAIAEAFVRGNTYHLNLTPEPAFNLTIQVAKSEFSKEDRTEFLARSIVPR
jgi:death on curing protein